MNKTKKLYFISIISILFIFFGAQNAFAANVSFGVLPSIKTGESLDVVVNVDTGGELVNAMEFVVSYDSDLLSFFGYSDNSSVIKLWINPPNVKKDDPGKISLSGIIPGGVAGLYNADKKELSAVPIVHLLFIAKKPGVAKFSFAYSKILKHDGVGTALLHERQNTEVTVTGNPNEKIIDTGTQENTTEATSPLTSSPDYIFWIIVFIVISGIGLYKLLKYRNERPVK